MIDETTPKKRGRPRKTAEPMAASPADAAPPLDAPNPNRHKKQVDVIQRRLKGGHLFSTPSQAIPLKDPAMRPRWFNRGISDDRFWVAEQQKGWVKVHVDDVASLDAVSGYTRTPEGYITRGPRGEEMLYMMPKADYDAIAFAKAEANVSRIVSDKKRGEAVAEATAAAFGPAAGEYLEQAGGKIESWKGPDG